LLAIGALKLMALVDDAGRMLNQVRADMVHDACIVAGLMYLDASAGASLRFVARTVWQHLMS